MGSGLYSKCQLQTVFKAKCNKTFEVCQSSLEHVCMSEVQSKAQKNKKNVKYLEYYHGNKKYVKSACCFENSVLSVENKLLLSCTNIPLMIFYVSISHGLYNLKMIQEIAFSNPDLKQHAFKLLSLVRILFWKSSKKCILECQEDNSRELSALKTILKNLAQWITYKLCIEIAKGWKIIILYFK